MLQNCTGSTFQLLRICYQIYKQPESFLTFTEYNLTNI